MTPAFYGAETSEHCGEICEERDRMETVLLKYVMEMDKPVLGICRGIQFINAALGGTLYQHLPGEHPSELIHRQKPPYDRPSHTVILEQTSPLEKLLDTGVICVNSCHHQGIKTLAPSLCPMAEAGDGLVEAVYMPEKRFVWAVQWHPEFSYITDVNSRKILRIFVEKSGGKEN